MFEMFYEVAFDYDKDETYLKYILATEPIDTEEPEGETTTTTIIAP